MSAERSRPGTGIRRGTYPSVMPDSPRRASAVLTLVCLLVAGCGPAATQSVPVATTSGPSPTVADSPAPPSPASPSAPGSNAPSAPPSGPFDPEAVSVRLEVVASGLDSPLAVTHAGDGSSRLFV